jgi:hypothetical protein
VSPSFACAFAFFIFCLAFFLPPSGKRSLPDGGKEKASTSKACLTAVNKKGGKKKGEVLDQT